jgi:hypothetical protein
MRFRVLSMRRVVSCVSVVVVCAATTAFAQDEPPKLPMSQLESLVAPIALYPDQILAQVLTASTFPDECVAANSWAQQHKDQHGDELSQAMSEAAFEWDPSVQALVPFPTVLETMTRNRGDLDRLGTAVLAQRGDVMDAIQTMRQKAQEAGNLKSGEQMTVTSEGSDIIIQPANPQVIYVPTYDPAVVYAPAPAGNPAAGMMFGFMAGVMVAEMFDNDYYGGCGFMWGSGTVVIAGGAWGRTYYNRGYYRPPYPPPRPVYGHRGNTNINIDNSTNINTGNINTGDRNKINTGDRNTNIGDKNKRNTDIDHDKLASDRDKVGTDAKQRSTKTPASGKASTASSSRPKSEPGSSSRGYSQQSGKSTSKSAFEGSSNGRKEQVASSRGHASSSARSGGSQSAHRGGRKR